jgi:LysM repeat protein
MANGAPFDQYDPTTTANNEYPMGTWLRVTNPINGKSVTVQVRDRGGFGHGLDLSRAAYFALEPPNGWGFRVRYEQVSGPDAPPKAAPKPAPPPAPKPTPKPEPPPAAEAPKPVAQRVEPPSRGGRPAPSGKQRTVAEGETLRAIAAELDVSVGELIEINQLDNADSIGVGQVLAIPSKIRTYVIQPGDTLIEIADNAGVTRAQVLAMNDIDDPDMLRPGQELKIPG